MTIHEWLKRKGACLRARQWADDKTWPEIYATCPHGGWLLWLFDATNPTDDELYGDAYALFAEQRTIEREVAAVRSVLTFEAFNTPWEDA